MERRQSDSPGINPAGSSVPTVALIWIKAPAVLCRLHGAMWEPITSAPYDDELELAVIDGDGEHCLVFPCRRTLGGWLNAETGARIDVRPTHWRAWNSGFSWPASAPAGSG
jgi:hypothetical protein